MGLLDKVKNLFTEPEEPEDEIKVEQIKREIPKTVVEPKIVEPVKERQVENIENTFVDDTKSEEQQLTREKVKTPIFFTEKDFADLEPEKPKKIEKKKEVEPKIQKREEKKQPYSGSYTSTSILTKEKPTFKPTPIISPIYGILDKNYTKDDIVERKDNKERKVNEVVSDKLDEVRNKAYGNLENDLEETLYSDEIKPKHSMKRKKIEEEIDLFDELEKEENNKVNLADTAELAKTVTEQEENIRQLEEVTMDLTKELDNLLLKRESYNQKKEKIEKKEKTDEELTENELFNLIDSMYEEGKE